MADQNPLMTDKNPPAVIFDLDNCLSDDAHRIPLIDWSKDSPGERYAAYHAACGQDKPANVRLFQAYLPPKSARQYRIVFMTARPDAVRQETIRWIRSELGCSEFTLLMRNNTDHRPSVAVKRSMLSWLPEYDIKEIGVAYDDRDDILAMYKVAGINSIKLQIHDVCAYTQPPQRIAPTLPASVTAADVLAEMADTYRARNKVYGDNFKMVAKLMAVLFPHGVPPELVVEDQFHLFELVLVKLSRYAISNLTHIDSAHDAAVYFAMCEAINRNKETK